MDNIFTIFRHFTELLLSFSRDFDNFRNYGPDIYICGGMALKSTRIYVIMGANFSGKVARPHHIVG